MVPSEVPEDSNQDFEIARRNIHETIEKVGETLDSAILNATQIPDPKMYDSVSKLAVVMKELNESLLKIRVQNKEIQKEGPSDPSSVTQNLFVGSLSELQKMMKEIKSDPELR
jgi:hypothetical protein